MTSNAGRRRPQQPSQQRGSGKISCGQCKRSFDSAPRLEEHQKEMVHECDQCNAHFQYQSGLNTHMADKHGEDTQCEKCGANLGRKDNHARHYQRFHETGEWYWCGFQDCPKEDYSLWNIKKHMENITLPTHIGKGKGDPIKGIKTAAQKEAERHAEKEGSLYPHSPRALPTADKPQPHILPPAPTSAPRPSYADIVKRATSMSPGKPPAPQLRLQFPGSVGDNDYSTLIGSNNDITTSPDRRVLSPSSPFADESLYDTCPAAPQQFTYENGNPPSTYPGYFLQPSAAYNGMGNQPMESFMENWNKDIPLVGDGSIQRYNYLGENLHNAMQSPWGVAVQHGANEQAMSARGTKSMPPTAPTSSRPRRTLRGSVNKRRRGNGHSQLQPIPNSDHGSMYKSPRGVTNTLFAPRGSNFSTTLQNNGPTDHQRNSSSSFGHRSDMGKFDLTELANQVEDFLSSRHYYPAEVGHSNYDRKLIQDFLIFSTGGLAGRQPASAYPVMGSSVAHGRQHTPAVDMEVDASDVPELTEEYDTITTLGFVPENAPRDPVVIENRSTEQPHLAVTPEERGGHNVNWLAPEFNSMAYDMMFERANDISVADFNNDVDDKMEMSRYSDASTARPHH